MSLTRRIINRKPGKLFCRTAMSIIGLAAAFYLLPATRAQSLPQIPSAETNAAPTAAALGGTTYVAWMGKTTPAADIWFTTSAGSGGWNSQQAIRDTSTTQAPALAAVGNTLYLAWRGQSPNLTDKIYYSTNTGAGWASAHPTVCSGNSCAETTATPALASNGSTLYVAWTTADNTIMLARFTPGSPWMFATTPATTNARTAPALVIYQNTLFLAWVAEGSSQVMYATLPLSGGSWSQIAATPAITSVAPTMGVYTNSSGGGAWKAGLYLVWASGGQMDYADWDDGWGASVHIPGLPIPPGPLTPALVSVITAPSFSLVYAAPAAGESYEDIYVYQLSQ
jgi:hypothetical protein